MLQAIRDRITGIVAWVIIIGISITFALWGIDSYLRRNVRTYVAKVNDTEISERAFRRAVQQQLRQMRVLMGNAFRPSRFNTPEFRRRVLDRMIEEELIVEAAHDAGMAISDAYLASRIRAIPQFRKDGKFDRARYEAVLKRQGMPPALFEAQVRRSLLVNQYIGAVTGSALATSWETAQGLRLQAQQRRFAHVRIPVARFRDQVQVSEKAIRDWYESHRKDYQAPEKVKLAWIELDLDDIARGLEADPQEVRKRYEERVKALANQEERRVRHILIQVPTGASEADEEAAKKRIEEIRREILSGKIGFADAAKKYSQDPGSAKQGGDLGYFGRGVMDPAFEKAAFSLEKGKLSEPVRSQFGYHLIEVEDIRKVTPPSFEELRPELEKEAVREEAEKRFYEKQDELANLTFEHPDTLETAAQSLGLKIHTSDWITRKGTAKGVTANPDVLEAAFSDEVLVQGNNSLPIELGPNHVVVVRVVDHRKAQPLPFEQVRDRIRKALIEKKAREQARALGEKLLGRLRAGEPLEKAAQALGLEVEQEDFVRRDEGKLDPKLVREVFRMPRQAPGKRTFTGFTLDNGDYEVVVLQAVKDADPGKVDAGRKASFARNLARLSGRRELDAVIASLKAKADIDINEDMLK
ncbi:MAG: peptidylprolyl isomerase [Gammaproteobacteria bacterium]|nr:MAG: peptidylprolyl isomerase [Gammaproteobacteria bacterium]